MRLYITGGTGLVGSNIIRLARQRNDIEIIAAQYGPAPGWQVDYELDPLDMADTGRRARVHSPLPARCGESLRRFPGSPRHVPPPRRSLAHERGRESGIRACQRRDRRALCLRLVRLGL